MEERRRYFTKATTALDNCPANTVREVDRTTDFARGNGEGLCHRCDKFAPTASAPAHFYPGVVGISERGSRGYQEDEGRQKQAHDLHKDTPNLTIAEHARAHTLAPKHLVTCYFFNKLQWGRELRTPEAQIFALLEGENMQ